MNFYKSPGQKRRHIVKIVSVVFLVASTYAAANIMQKVTAKKYAWTQNKGEVSAVIVGLEETTEKYRTLKGKRRTRTVYSLNYSFDIDGRNYTNTKKITSSLYDQLSEEEVVAVWYSQQDPNTNELASKAIGAIIKNVSTTQYISSLFYTVPGTWFLYYLLTLAFVRESKKAMPKGFFTENSWLDVDDRFVVVLHEQELIYWNIDKHRIRKVQECFQNDGSFEKMFELSKTSKVNKIPLAQVTKLVSRHNSDVIEIECQGESHSVEFLNQAIKAHALERIVAHLPPEHQHIVQHKTRLQASGPALIALGLAVVAFFLLDIFIVNLIIGFAVVVWLIPKIIARLIDPTVIQSWGAAEHAS